MPQPTAITPQVDIVIVQGKEVRVLRDDEDDERPAYYVKDLELCVAEHPDCQKEFKEYVYKEIGVTYLHTTRLPNKPTREVRRRNMPALKPCLYEEEFDDVCRWIRHHRGRCEFCSVPVPKGHEHADYRGISLPEEEPRSDDSESEEETPRIGSKRAAEPVDLVASDSELEELVAIPSASPPLKRLRRLYER